MLFLSTAMLASASTQGCDLSRIATDREAYEALTRRAVQIVTLAANPEPKSESSLNRLVGPSASFSYGGGDVRIPLESGVEGARALAKHMRADRYQVMGWDYMARPGSACSNQKVSAAFINSKSHILSKVDFTFDQGKVIAAEGWSRTFETGPLAPSSEISDDR